MQSDNTKKQAFTASVLPWVVFGVSLVVYVVTLNGWVSMRSLSWTAKILDWDWTPPLQGPLLYLLTSPVKWLPAAWQTGILNFLSALCAAGALGLLARSVALLPHDRTHEQRIRERNEHSLLSIPGNWIPPVLAALVCGLQLTFWENAVTMTGESLDLLIFAYCIRCLLEFRIKQTDSWLYRMAFVYGLGMTNNWAMVGFLPLFVIATAWIKGLGFLNLSFLARMAGLWLAGLALYVAIPLVWVMKDPTATFWEMFRTTLGTQRALLMDMPVLRNRALLLSLTSILPVFLMGIRWPSSFGDTSVAGALFTNVMFRVVHVVFLAACVAVAFDQQYSPRALGLGLPFLSFYFLGALAIGYYSGYVLLVFRDFARKSWQKQGALARVLNPLAQGAVLLTAAVVPVALLYKNLPVIKAGDGKILQEFARISTEILPEQPSILLSEDSSHLLLLEGWLRRQASGSKHVLVNTRMLPLPMYHKQLEKHYQGRWKGPEVSDTEAAATIDELTLLSLVTKLAVTNHVYYLHPSFGYFFEKLYALPHGTIYQLALYPTNELFEPKLSPANLDENRKFWSKNDDVVARVEGQVKRESSDVKFIANYYSRALNNWGVTLQRNGAGDEAIPFFERAAKLNTNNVPARANLEFALERKAGTSRHEERAKRLEDLFGTYRTWDAMMVDNGPFDEPLYCLRLGQLFADQNLLRQSLANLARARELGGSQIVNHIALAEAYLRLRLPDKTLEVLEGARRTFPTAAVSSTNLIHIVALEAGAHYAKTNRDVAEKLFLEARAKYPDSEALRETMTQFYRTAAQYEKAHALIDQQLAQNPDNHQLLLEKASLFVEEQKYDQALAQLDRLPSREATQVATLLSRSLIHIYKKDFKGAEEQARKALSQEPDSVQALTYLAIALIERKEYDKAVEAMNKVLDRDPNNLAALRNRAIARLQSGKLDQAQEDYEELLKLMPRSHPVYYGLGEIAYQQKDKAEAVRNYELYMKYAPAEGSTEHLEERKRVETRLQELKGGK